MRKRLARLPLTQLSLAQLSLARLLSSARRPFALLSLGLILGFVGLFSWALSLSTPAWAASESTPSRLGQISAPRLTDEPRWSYEEDWSGPKHWGELDPRFATCDVGQQQSPIDLNGATAVDLPNLLFDYAPSPVQVVNNGRTLQVNYASGSKMRLAGDSYELLQFHFHSPSEHQIQGVRSPMELHLVHRNSAGTLAVVGVMIEPGPENLALQGVWDNLLPLYTPATDTTAQVDANQLLPNQQTSYRYLGSLTTPPCSEGVHWIVMEHPLQLSRQQIAEFQQLFQHNRRPLQVLNGRSLRLDSSP